MIVLTKTDSVADQNCIYVRCPQCDKKLCDKPFGIIAFPLKTEGNKIGSLSHLLFKCARCQSKCTVTSDEISKF